MRHFIHNVRSAKDFVSLLVCLSLWAPVPLLGQVPAAAPALEIAFAGTSQEVKIYRISGREPGPVMLIVSGIHGDEPLCSLAADSYTGIGLEKGQLVVVPRLNRVALRNGRRNGAGGDMNRLFGLPENSKNPDIRVVNLTRSLIRVSDYVLNLHQGRGFYSPVWVDPKRNPRRWGQCNVIDAPSYDLPNGDKLELERYAKSMAEYANGGIADRNFHFLVNNTDTSSRNSRHMEQRKSLTYYALTKEHKISVGIEVTKNCRRDQALSFLYAAINAAMKSAGILAVEYPS